MASFPTLKTGVAAQYPLTRGTRFSTYSVRFLDGSVQTFRLNARGLRQWTIELDGLDDTELDSVISFVEAVGGGLFSYTDPTSGENVATCRLGAESFEAVLSAESVGHAVLTIEEVA